VLELNLDRSKILAKSSTLWVRRTNVTDRQQTDDRRHKANVTYWRLPKKHRHPTKRSDGRRNYRCTKTACNFASESACAINLK